MLLTCWFTFQRANSSLAPSAKLLLAPPLFCLGLQELDLEGFDGVLCIDAMEFIFPEDWPRVLSNLKRALNIGGYLYLTVERVEDAHSDHGSYGYYHLLLKRAR